MQRQAILFILVSIITRAATYGLVSSRTFLGIAGVTGFKLVGVCKLYDFTQLAQSMNAWVLACPRTDLIRLWPLPVQQPLFDD